MNNDKAREFFSSYHEGSLEPGLRASLERRLRADSDLKAEYDAFAATLASLDALRHEAIEVPAYLSDRIATRLESATAAKPAPFWVAWLAPAGARPSYALGLACALLVAAVGLRGLDSGDVSPATLVPGKAPAEPVRWDRSTGDLVATFAPDAARVLTVVPEGGEPQEFALAKGQPLQLTFRNPNRLAKRFKVTQGDEVLATVAIPGTHVPARRGGSGTVTELASALADAYHTPVVVKSADPGAVVPWSLDGTDPLPVAEKSLRGGRGHATMMEGNVLQIGP